MLIANKTLDYETIHKLSNNPESVVAYIEDMVPKWARHIKGITDNQRFYAAVHVRKMLTLPYQTRHAITEALVDGIYINGIVYDFITLSDLLALCDKDTLLNAIEEQLKRDGKI